MSIKYHDNMNGEQYGADHKLTDNWNPDGCFGDNEYAKVYFRIDTKRFNCMGGMFESEKDKTAFHTEIRQVFNTLDWKIDKKIDNMMNVENGNEGLFIHPLDISGIILKKNVKQIAEALNGCKTIKIRWVDIYDDVYDITDDEYADYLETQKEKVIDYILHNYGTTRTRFYYYTNSICSAIARRIERKRVNNDGYKWNVRTNTQAYFFIEKIIKELVNQGYMVSIRDGERVRVINKTEQKKLKLKI